MVMTMELVGVRGTGAASFANRSTGGTWLEQKQGPGIASRQASEKRCFVCALTG